MRLPRFGVALILGTVLFQWRKDAGRLWQRRGRSRGSIWVFVLGVRACRNQGSIQQTSVCRHASFNPTKLETWKRWRTRARASETTLWANAMITFHMQPAQPGWLGNGRELNSRRKLQCKIWFVQEWVLLIHLFQAVGLVASKNRYFKYWRRPVFDFLKHAGYGQRPAAQKTALRSHLLRQVTSRQMWPGDIAAHGDRRVCVDV